MAPYQAAFERFAQNVQEDVLKPMEPPDPSLTANKTEMETLASALGYPRQPNVDSDTALANALQAINAPEALRESCSVVNKDVRPTKVPQLDKVLFPDSNRGNTASDAMRGLLLALEHEQGIE